MLKLHPLKLHPLKFHSHLISPCLQQLLMLFVAVLLRLSTFSPEQSMYPQCCGSYLRCHQAAQAGYFPTWQDQLFPLYLFLPWSDPLPSQCLKFRTALIPLVCFPQGMLLLVQTKGSHTWSGAVFGWQKAWSSVNCLPGTPEKFRLPCSWPSQSENRYKTQSLTATQ